MKPWESKNWIKAWNHCLMCSQNSDLITGNAMIKVCTHLEQALMKDWEEQQKPFDDTKKAESFTSSNKNGTQMTNNKVIDLDNQKWISVKDKLPMEEDYYLTVVIDNGNSHFMKVQRFYPTPRVLKGVYADTKTHWELTQWDDYIVTHWMPLPSTDSITDKEKDESFKKI